MKKRIAVYAGSFDPVTNGHLWVIQCGLDLCEELIVAVGTNPAKHYTFPLEERVKMLEDSLCDSLVKVRAAADQVLVRYAAAEGAHYMIRGLRTQGDYEHEHAMWAINHGMEPGIKTVFVPAAPELAHVSSSMVKELAQFGEWEELGKYVPDVVLAKLKERFR